MKSIKLSLAIVVIAAIVFFVIRSFATTEKVGEVTRGGNPFIDKIQDEIKLLQSKPVNSFSRELYNEIIYHINEYHAQNRFSKNTIENSQWKENLSRQLYAVYVEKFIDQALYVFGGSNWERSSLDFIRRENEYLQSSLFLDKNSSINSQLNKIRSIFSKYDEITSFIVSSKNLSFFKTDLDAQFPIDEVRNRIDKSRSYLNNGLENSYVNNCTRLHNELKEIPKNLFISHVRYLDNMVDVWSNMYSNYNSQKAYVEGLYSPLEAKLSELDNDIYKVPDFETHYSRLSEKWQGDSRKAYGYFNSK